MSAPIDPVVDLVVLDMNMTEAQLRNYIRIARGNELNEPCPAYHARCVAWLQELDAELAEIGRTA